MRIERITWRPVRLPLRRRVPGHGETRWSAIVSIASADGRIGVGEASPTPGFPTGDVAQTDAGIEAGARALLGTSPDDPGAAEARIEAATGEARAARAGLATAVWSLTARRAGRPLADLLAEALGSRARTHVTVAALVTGSEPGDAAKEALRHVENGLRALKLKIGSDATASDLARLRAVAAAVGEGVELRVDGNGRFSEARALAVGRELAALGVAVFEQPVPAHDLAALARLRRALPLAVAADEAAATPEGAARVLAADAADVLVVKPSVAGGPGAALAMVAHARRTGTAVLVTSALEGTIGIAAALHLAAALPPPCVAAGLATGALLADDVAQAPRPRDGTLALPAGPGLGLSLDPRACDRLAAGPEREVRG